MFRGAYTHARRSASSSRKMRKIIKRRELIRSRLSAAKSDEGERERIVNARQWKEFEKEGTRAVRRSPVRRTYKVYS